MIHAAAVLGLVVASACASTQSWTAPTARDSHDDPAAVRPGFGNNELHVWWPLTAPEVAAVQGIDRAREGDARALLALAVAASGDRRDAASHEAFGRRFDQVVSSVKPVIAAAADEWHRGYELNRAMHRLLLGGERGDLGTYQVDQSRITGIFAGGRYNCLSSAMLYVVLARAFALPVRGVLVPTHAFVELGAPGGKVIEVETTSATGFDWVHDERFYREEARAWSGRRGLRPVTLDEYRGRVLLEPYRLMAAGMRNRHVGEGAQDRSRLNEIAALVDPDDGDTQRGRIEAYINEANELHGQQAWRTTARFFDVVGTIVAETGARGKDAKTLGSVAWVNWYFAHALMIVGRQKEAMALVDVGLRSIDPNWQEAASLRRNYISEINDHLGELMTKKDYRGAVRVFAKYRDVCGSEDACARNAAIVYGNWSIEYQNAGDWQGARQVLRECVAALPTDKGCLDALGDLESRHRF